MKLKNYIKRIVANNPQITPAHGMPLNRRDLFAQGYLGFGAYYAVPSLLTMLSNQAYGQNETCGSGELDDSPGLVVLDCAGGINLPGRNFWVGDKDWNPLPIGSYATMGVDESNGQRSTQISEPYDAAGILMNPLGAITQGLIAGDTQADASAVSAEALAKTDGCYIASISNDDTQNNPLNPAGYVARIARGELTTIVSSRNSATGGNSIAPEGSFFPTDRPVQIRNTNDAINLVTPGRLVQAVGESGLQRILRAAQDMTQAQIQRFANQSMDEQLIQILECAGQKGTEQLSGFDAADLDIANDTDDGTLPRRGIAPLFTNRSDGQDLSALGASVKLVLDGFAKVAVNVIGGCDYHGGDQNRIVSKDLEVGRALGAIIEAAHRKQKNVMIALITDGGTSCRTDKPETAGNNGSIRDGFLPASDNGQRSGICMFFINGAGTSRIPLLKKNIGGFKSDGSIDATATDVSNSSDRACRLVALHYMLFKGMSLQEAQTILGDQFDPSLIVLPNV